MTQTQKKSTNRWFACLMIEIMEFVNKYDFFPKEYWQLLRLQKEYSLDEISDSDFDNAVYKLAVNWFNLKN